MTSLRSAISNTAPIDEQAPSPPLAPAKAGAGTITVGVLTAVLALAFAAVNVVFETTGYIPHSPGARVTEPQFRDSIGIAIADWLVAAVKVIGAAVALASLARRSRLVGPRLLAGLLWAAFSTLAVYALGNVVESLGAVAGVTGTLGQIRPIDVGYVLFFLLFAAGFAVLAVSYLQRFHLSRRIAVLGALAGPVAIALLLGALPAVLNAFELLPPL